MEMTTVCPFAKAACPDDASLRKLHSAEPESNKVKKDAGDSPPKCPFGFDSQSSARKIQGETEEKSSSPAISSKCPFGFDSQTRTDQEGEEAEDNKAKKDIINPPTISPKCPFGYDSQSFKLGPFSCVICQALLFGCSKCVPCSHVYCKACISRFKDCPLCGADIEKVEADDKLQGMVDRFIEGHARIKRPPVTTHNEEGKEEQVTAESKTVIYEDVSLERGSFLVQQAMRAFRAQNIDSAKSRLSLCAEDLRDQLDRLGNTSELCSQLGAVLGMLGDCCRATGDAGSAVTYFQESVQFLSKLPTNDLEITHTLSVSLNKIGDLKYYDGDLKAARSYYLQSLNVRQEAVKNHPDVPSQTLDVAISLAKVADVDGNLGNEDVAVNGFQEGIKLLESLTLKSEDTGLEQRRQSVMEFLKGQLAEKDTKLTHQVERSLANVRVG